jgi:hypothetical protein
MKYDGSDMVVAKFWEARIRFRIRMKVTSRIRIQAKKPDADPYLDPR